MFKRLSLIFAAFICLPHFSNAQPQNQVPVSESTPSGYFNTTELGFNKGFLHQNTGKSVSLQTINGYKFNSHISAGLGIGIDKYLYEGVFENGLFKGYTFMPVFSDVRIYFGKGNTQPYFGQAVGYSFCLYNPNYNRETGYNHEIGGILINPSFGIKTPLTAKSAINISLGYRFQEFTIKNIPFFRSDFGDPQPLVLSNFKSVAHYLSLKAGITF